MPFGDGTGPMGLGPMTGRGMGYCAGFQRPGFMNPYSGRGFFGRGMGMGRGFRRWYRAGYNPYYSVPYNPAPYQWYPDYPYGYSSSPQDEKEALKQQAEILKAQLQEIQNRIYTLEEKG